MSLRLYFMSNNFLRMNKFQFTLIALIFSFSTFSQEDEDKFQWVTAAQSMVMTYVDMDALPEGGAIALAERYPLNYITMDIFFVQGDGEKYDGYELTQNSSANLLMSFDKEGVLNWVHPTNPKYSHVYNISISDNGDIDLLVKIREKERNDKNKPMGYFMDPEDEYPIPAGYGIVTIDKNGYFDSHRPILNINNRSNPKFHHFERFGDEIIINGNMHDGKLTTNLDVKAGPGGGSFIMSIDKYGTPTWADIVSSSKKTCCTTSKPSSFDIASDGTIYFGGMYIKGGIFSNGEEILAPPHVAPNEMHNAWEAYVISYSPKRKINWVKSVGSQSRIGKLVASDEGVYFGYTSLGKKSFGKKIKTKAKSTTVLTFLNKKGKLEWNHVTEVKSIETMNKGQNGTLIISGRSDDRPTETPRKFGNFEFGAKDELFVATLTSSGEVMQFWSADLWTSSNPVFVSTDSKGSYYIALETFCSMKIDMNLINESFPKLKCYGGTPVLGKVKYN